MVQILSFLRRRPPPPRAPLRQLSATHSEVGGRGREGRGGRNLGIYLIRSQQPGRALYSSVIFDSKRGKKKQNSYGGRGVGGCVCVPLVEGGCFCRGKWRKTSLGSAWEKTYGSTELLQCVKNARVLAVFTTAHVATFLLVGVFLLSSTKSQAQLNCRLLARK